MLFYILRILSAEVKGIKMMKSKKYGMMLAVLAAAGGVSVSAAPVPVYELKGLTVTATRQQKRQRMFLRMYRS